MRFALIGRPGAGKKTFFSLLTARAPDEIEAPVTLHGLTRRKGARREGDALVGTAPIRDDRLAALSRLFEPERTIPAENTIVLCPDLPEGDSDRKWLEPARRSDLLCVLLRGFDFGDPEATMMEQTERQRRDIESDLLLADLETIETRLNRLEKEMRGGRTSRQEFERDALLKIKEKLESEMKLCSLCLEPRDIEPVRSLGLLSLQPVIWVHNVD